MKASLPYTRWSHMLYMILICGVLLITYACKEDEDDPTTEATGQGNDNADNNSDTQEEFDDVTATLPTEVSQLYRIYNPKPEGNTVPLHDTVILYVQGGPLPVLEEKSDVDFNLFNNDKGFKDRILKDKSVSILQIHQVQTLHNFTNKNISFEQAKKEAKKNPEILQKVIEDLKSKGKYVAVWGFSYGFFINEYLLATEDQDFDRMFLGAGRIDMSEDLWKPFSEGKFTYYQEDAVTIRPAQTSSLGKAIPRLAAGISYLRFTDLLSNVELDENKIMFYFGGKDVNVGRLDQGEIDFLVNRGTNYAFHPDLKHDIRDEDFVSIMNFLLSRN